MLKNIFVFIFSVVCIYSAMASKQGVALANDLTGSYTNSSNQTSVLLEIVESSTGAIQGSFSIAAIDTDGNYFSRSSEIAGQADGTILTIKILPSNSLLSAKVITGEFDGTTLFLLDPNTGPFQLKKSDRATHILKIEELQTKAKKIINDDTVNLRLTEERKRLLSVNFASIELEKHVVDFVKRSEKRIPEIQRASILYRTVTQRLAKTLQKLEQTPDQFDQNAMVFDMRSATSNGGPMQEMKYHIDRLRRGYDSFQDSLNNEFNLIDANCEINQPMMAALSEQETVEFKTACNLKIELYDRYKKATLDTSSAFDDAERAYSLEVERQTKIVSDAENRVEQ